MLDFLGLDARKLFGSNLKKFRLRLNLSQRGLGARIGVSEQTIHDLEKGKRWPKYTNVKALAEELGVDESTFFQQSVILPEPTIDEALEVLIKATKKKV